MKTIKHITLLLLAIICCLSFVACADVEESGVWENATYVADKTLGKGEKTLTVVITAEGQNLTFTIKTDKETLGDALDEHDLIEHTDGLIHTINGIAADFDDGGWYWRFTKSGEMMMQGAFDTDCKDGEQYEFERTNSF